MSRAGHLDIDTREVDPLAQSMVVVLTYWLSYEYVRNPRGRSSLRTPRGPCCAAPTTRCTCWRRIWRRNSGGIC